MLRFEIKKCLALILPLTLLAGCASTPKLGGDPALKVYEASALPPPDGVNLTTGERPYRVGAFDKLIIDVFGMPELSQREVQVDASGNISFPLAGVVDVAGRTPGEIQEILAQHLRANFIRDPKVTVNLREAMGELLTVEGQVTKPGLYPVMGHLSLLRAMALAGGTTEFSKLNDVVIFRTVQGQRLAALYDLNQIRHGAYADPEVFPNDIVMVGDDRGRRLFKDVLQALPAALTPIIFAVDRITK